MSAERVALVIGHQSLQLLRDAAQFVPVPAIGVAASVAVALLELVLTAGSNKEAFIAIGKDTCIIMVTIVQRVNLSANGGAPPMNKSDLERDAQSLLAEVKMIKKVVKKHLKRGIVKRLVFSSEDAVIVEECQRRLDHALRLFGLQSDIEVRKQLALLNDKVQEILENVKPPPQMPQPFAQSYPPSQGHLPTWPQTSIPSHPSSPQPLMPSHPSSPQPSIPSHPSPPPPPAFTPPTPQPQTREDRRTARHARRDARVAQQAMNVTGFPGAPADSTFSNVQNHLSPEGNISYSYVNGNVVNNNRDDSFNVAGTNNSISIAFTR